MSNALAALTVGLEFDVSVEVIARALAEFRGVERRFEIVGERGGITVIDDYSHHPAKVRAALSAAREGLNRRIVVAYQPHRYSRTRDVFDELARAFHDADVLVLTEIYAAGEPKLAGVTGEVLAEAVRACGHRAVEFVPEKSAIVPRLRELVRPGDLVFFMGAGDIGRLAKEFLASDGGSPNIDSQVARELQALLPQRVVAREPLADWTSLRVGGPADAFVRIETREDLALLIGFCHEHGLPLFVLGGGFNTLARDGGVRGVVARLAGLREVALDARGRVRAEAGASHAQLTRFAAERAAPGSSSASASRARSEAGSR